MIDLYLRAADEAAMIEALPFLRGQDDDGNPAWITSSQTWALDVIGPLEVTPGIYDEEGAQLVAPVVDGRFHANLRCAPEIAAQVPEEVRTEPSSPRRMWA